MGLGRFGLLSRNSQNIFILQIKIRQLILENGDERLDKIFSGNFRKKNIGFNKKIIFAVKNMRCDDADVMMMQKEKQAKSNLGKTPGHYTVFQKSPCVSVEL